MVKNQIMLFFLFIFLEGRKFSMITGMFDKKCDKFVYKNLFTGTICNFIWLPHTEN